MDKPLYQNTIANGRPGGATIRSFISRRLVLLLILYGVVHVCKAQFVLNTAFGDNGKLIFSVDNYDQAIDIVTVDGDSLLVAGNAVHTDTINRPDVFVVRVTPDGKIDSSFAQQGLLRFDFDGFDFSTANELLTLPSGNFFLLGSGYSSANSTYVPFCVTKILRTGIIDSSFGTNGTLHVDFAGLHETAENIKADQQGRILLFGATIDTGDLHSDVPVIARLDTNGVIDNSFGDEGRVYLRFPQGIVQDRSDRHLIGGLIQDAVILNDGRILVAGGYSNALNLVSFFACLKNDGSLDSSFFNDGYLALDLTEGYNNDIIKIAVRGDDLFFAAKSSTLFSRDFYFGKINLPTSTYDVDAVDFQSNEDIVKDMLLSKTGSILLCGNSIDLAHNSPFYTSDHFALAGLINHSYPFSAVTSLFTIDPSYQNGPNCFTEQEAGALVCAGFVNNANNESDVAILGVSKTYNAVTEIGASQNAIQVYPNPATNNFTLRYSSGSKPIRLQLFNLAGKLLESVESISENSYTFNRNGIAAGVYFIQAMYQDGTPQTLKVILQ